MVGDLKLACVLASWERCKVPHPLYMWGLINTSTGCIEKFFLFYKKIKFHNITRETSAPKFVKEWIEKKRREEGISSKAKGEFIIKKSKQENSQQIKQFLDKVGEDFKVIYVEDLASQGLAWSDSLLETLVDLGTTEYGEIFSKMEKVPLSREDVILLKKAFTAQVEKFNSFSSSFTNSKRPINEKLIDKVQVVAPDQVIGPKKRKIWLNRVGEELEGWVTSEDEIMSQKSMREAWTEAVKIKRLIEKTSASQETMLEKQDATAERIQRLSDIVQDIKTHLEKKRDKKSQTRPLRDEMKYELYQALMNTPLRGYTRHAHLERARKRVLFTLLYYTGARVNELRKLTYNDVISVIKEGRLKLVLHKQKDAIVRVLPTVGREEMEKLVPDIDFVFKEQKYTFLGQSHRKDGEVMHEKAWVAYVNREVKRVKEALNFSGVLSSHSFRVGFVTRHLKHADTHSVAKLIGHKNIGTTVKYNRYVVDEKKDREILDKGYKE